MHKSVLIAVVVASLLVAYPLTMLGISAEQSIQQSQNSIMQKIADSITQQESKQLPTLTQKQMQEQQFEKFKQLSLGAQQNQNSVTQMADSTTQQESKQLPTLTQKQMQEQQFEKFKQLSLGDQQNQNDELQMTEEIESQQEDQQLSIISQEKMQQAQFEKFKNLLNSVRDKHITVLQE